MSPPKVISYSELMSARCPLRHQLAYVERWTKIHDAMSPLSKGTAWHLVHEAHYQTIMRYQRNPSELGNVPLEMACRQRVEQVLSEQIEPTSQELADLIWWMYMGHLATYGTDDQWKILAVEHAAQCRLPTATGRPSGFVLKIKIDLVVQDRSTRAAQLWIVDAKSCRNLPKGKELDLDDQFGLYTWGLRKLGKKVFGQIHSAARTERLVKEAKSWTEDQPNYSPGDVQPLDERFLRTRMYRTDKELDVIAREAWLAAKTRYAQQREVARLGIDSPRHTDPQTCRYMCDFLEPCLGARKGVELRQFLRDKGFRVDHARH